MLARVARPQTIAWVLFGLLLLFFPYFQTWAGFDRALDEIGKTTGIRLTAFEVTMLAVWLVILTGLNLLTGYSGQISLGHGALVACGAYIAAVIVDNTSAPIAVAVLAGGLGAGLIGFGIGIPALRLTGPYLAIATLALIVSMPQILKMDAFSDWTGGATGINLEQARAPGSIDGLVDDRQWLYYSVMAPAIIMTVLAWNITRSRVGRAFIALRDSEIGAQQMGVNIPLYKTMAFGLSALYAGVGGGLFLYAQSFTSPESFSVFQSIQFLVVIVIGGLASILGGILAAAFFAYNPAVISRIAEVMPGWIAEPLEPFERLRWAIFGSVLIIVMVTLPSGAAGLVRRLGALRPADVIAGLRRASPGRLASALRSHPLTERLLGPAPESRAVGGEDSSEGDGEPDG